MGAGEEIRLKEIRDLLVKSLAAQERTNQLLEWLGQVIIQAQAPTAPGSVPAQR